MRAMDDVSSSDRLRHAGLAMLAEGNSAEAVAHVLEVPLDAVQAWSAQPQVAPPDAAPSPGRAAPSRRFDTALVQAPSTALRLTALAVAVVLAAVGLTFSYESFRDAHGRVDFLVDGLLFLIMPGLAARMMLGWARPALVLGRDEIVAPRALIAERMAYEDVAGYTLVRRTLLPANGVAFPGRLLSIQSRRPGVPPLTVFLHEKYPIDLRVLSRLDAVARATAVAPLSAVAAHRAPRDSGIPGAMSFAGFALIAVLGIVGFLPKVNDNLQDLARTRPSPPLGQLRHVEGAIATAAACVDVGRANEKRSRMRIGLSNRTGSTQVDIPCLFAPASLIEIGPHRLSVDVDPRSDPPDKVYQVALDGRVVLAYDTVAGRQPYRSRTASSVLLGVALAAIGVLMATIVLAWMRTRGRFGPN